MRTNQISRETTEHKQVDLAAIAAAIKDATNLDLFALKVHLTGTGQIATSTVYNLVADGFLPKPIKIGLRPVAWVKADVDAYLARAQKGA